uniref:G-protein coupled receptors family 2 profile 2 domain-containing protein n=1 Tax=Stomoxys calcitrans TaxID=35570 RepID=A0A1I8NNW7_STOCA
MRCDNVDNNALVIWLPSNVDSQTSVGICSTSSDLPIERYCHHNGYLNGIWSNVDEEAKLVVCGSEKCPEEQFEHFYVQKNKILHKHLNKWPNVRVDQMAMPHDLCLLESGLLLTRKCIFDYHGNAAKWETQDFAHVKCLRDIEQSLVTYDLNNLYHETRGVATNITNMICSDIIEKLKNLLDKENTMRIASDLQISTNIMQIITMSDKDPAMVTQVLQVLNLLMNSDEQVVHTSNQVGTPKTLVSTVETYFDGMTNRIIPNSKCHQVPDGVRHDTGPFTSIFYINPSCANISGIAVYNSSAHGMPFVRYDMATGTHYRYLYLNQSVEELLQEPNMESAAYFPESLWSTLAGKPAVEALKISLYKNTNFFEDEHSNQTTPESHVLKISLPGYNDDLPDDLPVIFQSHSGERGEDIKCGRYNYMTWNANGVETFNELHRVLCKTRQLTHFGALLGLRKHREMIGNSVALTVMVEMTLEIISLVGCSLSLFGLLCIWLTALCCPEWRSQSSNKLLMHICFVLTLIMSYFIFINVPDFHRTFIDMNKIGYCIAEGAFLQYTILVLFVWMFFIAVLQFQRYVTVIGVERPKHFLCKYAVAAWGLPVVPTVLVIYFDSTSYMPYGDNNTICYPSGRSLYLAVLLPICLVIISNIGIFFYILCSVGVSLMRSKRVGSRKNSVVPLRLTILLFFLLGLAWGFGIVAHISNKMVFSICFCLTSTLQGFVLFLFFVVFDLNARTSWTKIWCIKSYNSLEESTTMWSAKFTNSRG